MHPSRHNDPASVSVPVCASDHGGSGCSGRGLCPGVAVSLAYGIGIGTAALTGLAWIGWTVGLCAAIVLISGAWQPGSWQRR